MRTRHPHRPFPRAHGFTIVEIMVAVLIGLIGSIVIFQVLAVSERQKRTTTGAGDAQQNGLLALYTIEREARMAGYGINYLPLLGCNVVGRDRKTARDLNFPLVAARIIDGAAGAPDSIGFFYGSSSLLVGPSKLTQSNTVGSTQNKVNNRFGYETGDVILIGEAGKDCSIRQASELPIGVGATDQVNHIEHASTDAPYRFNQGGLTVAYSAWDNTSQSGGRLFSLGAAPVASLYSVQDGELLFQNLFTDAAPAPVTESIVQLQAEYGKDMNGDGVIDPAGAGGDLWEATMPVAPTAADWARVLAVRVAVVARSPQPEPRGAGAPVCTTTTAAPRWKDDGMGGGTPIAVNADPDWQCYRYRVFETTIPLRNMIWVAQ